MASIVLLVISVTTFLILHVKCGDVIPERKCATLFSEPNFQGKTFSLLDFDQSINLAREYRTSLVGWTKTGSFIVEDGCKLCYCNDTYFVGKCETVNVANAGSIGSELIVRSVNCTCQRDCHCEDINIPRDYTGFGQIARAYLQGGCDTCHSEYIPIQDIKTAKFTPFPENVISVTSFVIANGCNLEFTKYRSFPKFTIKGPIHQPNMHSGPFTNFTISTCNSTSNQIENDTQLPRLPASFNKLYELFHSNNTSAHPGLRAALRSAENGRSAQNVYIVLFIGEQNPYILGFPLCEAVLIGIFRGIWECTVLVPQPVLGISAEVRLIVVRFGWHDKLANDVKLMVALEMHLSSIKDLENAIPNAVIINVHSNDQYQDKNSAFYRKFHAVRAMAPLLLDESSQIVVFMLDRYFKNGYRWQRKSDVLIETFETEIRKTWPFPINIYVTPFAPEEYYTHRNGYKQMPNMEYFPRNLETILNYICERGGDPLGKEILKAYFLDNRTPRASVKLNIINSKDDNNRTLKYDKLMKDLMANTG